MLYAHASSHEFRSFRIFPDTYDYCIVMNEHDNGETRRTFRLVRFNSFHVRDTDLSPNRQTDRGSQRPVVTGGHPSEY